MAASGPGIEVQTLAGRDLPDRLDHLEAFALRSGRLELTRHPRWLLVLQQGLGQVPYCLEVRHGDLSQGFLPLVYVSSMLFGKFLVSMPYLNYGGPNTDDRGVEQALLSEAVHLAELLRVRYLEIREVHTLEHKALAPQATSKVHMRLALPDKAETLWKALDAKVRNQVRKGQKSGLEFAWGGEELLGEFYAVFSRNMRDLGTPVYSQELFRATLEQFPQRAELGIVRSGKTAIAGCLLLHGWGVTEVPSASSLREYNSTCANMLLYWHMLERSILRGQSDFDFGRSSPDSSTYRFKKQWGAEPYPSVWHHYLRHGTVGDVRPNNPKYERLVRMWQKMPVWMSRLLGPWIVSGIP